MKKHFYLNNETICTEKCDQSLGNCPLIQYVHKEGLEHNLEMQFNCQYVRIENFRHPELADVKNNLVQICKECAQRIKG